MCQSVGLSAAFLGQNLGKENPTGDEDGLSIGRWDLLDNGTGQASNVPATSYK